MKSKKVSKLKYLYIEGCRYTFNVHDMLFDLLQAYLKYTNEGKIFAANNLEHFLEEFTSNAYDIAIIIVNPIIYNFDPIWLKITKCENYPMTPFLFIHNGYAFDILKKLARPIDIISEMPLKYSYLEEIWNTRIKLIQR